MKCAAQKRCDLCKRVVAEKSLLWHTNTEYVTIRGDERPYSWSMQNTIRTEWHFCDSCFFSIMNVAKEKMENNERKAD